MFWVIAEATLAFVLFCADSVAEESARPARQRLVRAVCWPATLTVWFTHRNIPKLARFGAIVWLGVTGGWLVSLEHDRIHTVGTFALVAELTMAFVVYCVDAMSPDLHGRPLRRVARAVAWVVPVSEYLRDDDSVRLIQASVSVWVLLTTGWLLSLEADRLVHPFGWLAR